LLVRKLLLAVAVACLLPPAGICLSWVIPLAVIVPAVNWLIFRRYLKDWDSAAAAAGQRAREVVRFASVDYVGTVLGQAYGNMLPLLVLSALGAAAAASFYIAWTIASGLGLVAANFGMSLLVEGAAAPHRLAELTRGVLVRCGAVTVLGAAVLVLAARPILNIYGAGYAAQASLLLGLLAVGTIPACLVVVALSLDRIASRVGRATFTRLALAVLVLGGSWLLLRNLGIDGVGLAWVGGNLVVAMARFPTIAGAARRRAAPAPLPTPVRRSPAAPGPGVRMRPPRHGLMRRQRPGLHRRRPPAPPGTPLK